MTALPPARRSAHSAQPGSSAPGRKRPGQLLAVVLAGVLVVATIAARSGASEATIDGEHEGSGPDVGGQVLALQVGGRADVPLDAAAVVLNVTAVGPAGPGYVTAFPCDQQRPLASNLNYAPGDVVANLVIAKPDAAGKVCLYSHATTNLVADVSGYFPADAGYHPVTNPARLLDTRVGQTERTVDGRFQGIGPVDGGGARLELDVTGRGGVPAGVTAVVLNVTAVGPAGPGYVTAFPCDQQRPLASNLNYAPGDVVANLVIAKPDAAGKVCLYSHATTNLVADVSGYFPADTGYHPVTNPARLLDTRVVSSSAGGPVAGGTAVTLQVTDRAGVPASAAAVALNVTAVEPQGAGHVTVFPCSEPQPLASNLNYAPGDIVANLVIAKPDAAGKVCLFSHATTHLVADVSGHFPTGSGFVPITNPARILETRTPGSDGDDHGDHGNHGGGPQGGSEFGIPAFDEDDFLPRRPGSGDLRLQASAAPRDPAAGPFPGIGTFRVFCEASHMGYNDPILFPGVDGASHLHLFFGNTTTDAASNLNGMRNVGNSTCDGGIADRSAYWVPALYDPGTNQIIEPWIFAAYYQSGFSGLDPATVQPIPEGLRMIVGKATATPATYAEHNTFMQGGRWGCFSGAGGPTNTGADIPDCGSNRVTLVLNFPQCWDGRNLDSPDHISHMATPAVQRVGSSFVRACPATHPVVLPSIMLQVVYQNNGNNSGDWRLVSDMYPATENGGASLHADFVNGWDPGIMDLWLNNCVRAVRDCERSELGNGQALTSRFSR